MSHEIKSQRAITESSYVSGQRFIVCSLSKMAGIVKLQIVVVV